MKNIKFIYLKIILLFGLIFTLTVSCERDLSEDVEFAKFSTSSEVFIDGFSGGLSYDPFGGSKLDAFSVDGEVKYSGSSSMRFDVPSFGDPLGAYAGATFRDGSGRNLSGYDALTFWVKASQAATLNEVGFGNDFEGNKYLTTLNNVPLTTYWQKIVIPIPDASKLHQEKGMFWYAEGPENGFGYTFWVDDLKFEKLGTIGQPRPAIVDGEHLIQDTYTGVNLKVTGLTQTFNLGSGLNQTVSAAPSYFDFRSSDPSLASVNEFGDIEIINDGTPVITASLAGVEAAGSLTVNSLGDFQLAPVPTRAPGNVTSIFSDSYTNSPVDFFNGFWEPYQTTLSANFQVEGNNILNYTNFNFVGNQFANPTIDASQKSNVHIDMFIPSEVPSNMDFLITIVDFGIDQAQGGGDDTREQIFFDKSIWVANTWITLEFPITLSSRNSIGQIIYENINFSSLRSFYLDNIYFYSE